jgi:hypothetical protein
MGDSYEKEERAQVEAVICPRLYAGFITRVSICLRQEAFSEEMDYRVKPGDDKSSE